MAEKMITFLGIADAHGIECLMTKTGKDVPAVVLQIRAEANRHRHAVLFEADLTQEQADTITRMIGEDEAPNALRFMRAVAKEVRVERHFIRSFEMLPNPELDPYYEGGGK